ncbi:MAG: autotransporter outer membrane beta-barrel domain-containing protein [Candidatus Sedimenticola sp. 20ELBAFRAG]
MAITLSGTGTQADVYGDLSGRGTISGSGTMEINENAVVSPGHVRTNTSAMINTLTFENPLTFTNLGAVGSQAQPQYLAHIGISNGDNGLPNDRIQYHNYDMTLTDLIGIQVETATTLTATDLHGDSFTIISSKDGTSSGSLIGAGNPNIVEGGTILALIDFTVSNNSTNGKDDVTLTANNQGTSALTSHSSAQTGNRQSGSSLLINASNQGNTTISNALNTLLNNQVSTHLDSIHAEPFSSWLTVKLEHSDQILASVLHREQTHPEQGVWGHLGHLYGQIEGNNNLGNFDYHLTEMVFGRDLQKTKDSNFGLYAAIAHSDMSEHDLVNQSFESYGFHVGAYGYQSLEDWRFSYAGGVGHIENESERRVALGTSTGSNTDRFAGRTVYAGIEARRRQQKINAWLSIAPAVSVLASRYEQNKVSEHGENSLALTVDKADATSVITAAGLYANIGVERWQQVHPTALLRYEHDWRAISRGAHQVSVALSDHPDHKQSFEGQHRGANIFTVGLGFENAEDSPWKISGDVVLGLHDHGEELSAGLVAELLF